MSDDVSEVCDVFWGGTNGVLDLCDVGCGGCAYLLGAAALHGLVGMAMAIRENAPRVVERSYWTKLEGLALYDDHCSDCGVQIKTLEAGQDEGTDNEWCECDE